MSMPGRPGEVWEEVGLELNYFLCCIMKTGCYGYIWINRSKQKTLG
jgi:hypothetical protein